MNKFTKAITIESIGSSSSRLTGSFSAVRARSTTNKDPATRVRTVEASEWKAAAACLADAFAVDDVATYFLDCPDTASWSKERKWALHVKILQVMTFAHIKCGLVQAIGDPTNGGTFDAVALWMPPDTKMDGWLTIVRMGLWRQRIRLEWLLSKEGRARFFKEFMPLLHTTKAEVLKERDASSWYLVYIGTHTRARGKGLAKSLITEVTKKVREESLLLCFAQYFQLAHGDR